MNGIGRDFPKAQKLCGFLAIDLYKKINGCLSVPFFSWIGIDMVHHFTDFFFRIVLFCLVLRNYIPDQFMTNGRTVFTDVLRDLSHLEPLLEPRLDRQSVIIGKVFLAHRYLQSEGRTGTTIPEDDRKRNHEVAAATLWLPVHVILSATAYVAFNFSINLSDGLGGSETI